MSFWKLYCLYQWLKMNCYLLKAWVNIIDFDSPPKFEKSILEPVLDSRYQFYKPISINQSVVLSFIRIWVSVAENPVCKNPLITIPKSKYYSGSKPRASTNVGLHHFIRFSFWAEAEVKLWGIHWGQSLRPFKCLSKILLIAFTPIFKVA